MTDARLGLALAGVLLLGMAPQARALERPETADVAQNYLLFCGGCHGRDGAGVVHRVPALRRLDRFLRAEGGRDFVLRVPGVANSALSDAALADVLNWCLLQFGDPARPVAAAFTAGELAAARRRPLLAVRQTRHDVLQRAGGPPEDADGY